MKYHKSYKIRSIYKNFFIRFIKRFLQLYQTYSRHLIRVYKCLRFSLFAIAFFFLLIILVFIYLLYSCRMMMTINTSQSTRAILRQERPTRYRQKMTPNGRMSLEPSNTNVYLLFFYREAIDYLCI